MKLTIIRNTAFIVLLNFLTVVVLVVAQNMLQSRPPVSTPKPTATSITPTPKSATTASGGSNTVQQPLQQQADQAPPPSADQQVPQQADQPAPVIDTPAPLPTADNRCIVTVRGQQFDLTQFRFIHSGGDIFNCGTDMTNEFNAQHNDRIFQQLQQYKI